MTKKLRRRSREKKKRKMPLALQINSIRIKKRKKSPLRDQAPRRKRVTVISVIRASLDLSVSTDVTRGKRRSSLSKHTSK